jgi:cytochrome c oxidase assembly protein subunit 16
MFTLSDSISVSFPCVLIITLSLSLIWVLDNSKEVTKEKDDLEWQIIENTRSLSRLGPTESYKPKKRSLEEELKVN